MYVTMGSVRHESGSEFGLVEINLEAAVRESVEDIAGTVLAILLDLEVVKAISLAGQGFPVRGGGQGG